MIVRDTASPSSRRAWIEIPDVLHIKPGLRVALLAEGVDRNKMSALTPVAARVALLAEGVDRNSCAWPPD